MDARGKGGGLAGAQARAHLGGKRPGAGDRPAAADQAREQRLPALGGLVGEAYRAHTVLAQNAVALGESACHGLFVERLVLWPAIFSLLAFVLRRFGRLGDERLGRVESVAQERMTGQRALEPDEEEIRPVREGHSVAIGRVGEPNRGRGIAQRMLCGVGGLHRSASILPAGSRRYWKRTPRPPRRAAPQAAPARARAAVPPRRRGTWPWRASPFPAARPSRSWERRLPMIRPIGRIRRIRPILSRTGARAVFSSLTSVCDEVAEVQLPSAMCCRPERAAWTIWSTMRKRNRGTSRKANTWRRRRALPCGSLRPCGTRPNPDSAHLPFLHTAPSLRAPASAGLTHPPTGSSAPPWRSRVTRSGRGP